MDSTLDTFAARRCWRSAEALTGNSESAKLYLAEYTALEPDMTVRWFAEQRSSVLPDAVSPGYRRESECILDGLRRAGMPDWQNPCGLAWLRYDPRVGLCCLPAAHEPLSGVPLRDRRDD